MKYHARSPRNLVEAAICSTPPPNHMVGYCLSYTVSTRPSVSNRHEVSYLLRERAFVLFKASGTLQDKLSGAAAQTSFALPQPTCLNVLPLKSMPSFRSNKPADHCMHGLTRDFGTSSHHNHGNSSATDAFAVRYYLAMGVSRV